MKFKKYYMLIENVFKNWHSALSQSNELKIAVELMTDINNLGYECLIVGGSVRDLILGKVPNDVDLTTNCPQDIIDKNFKQHDVGKNKNFGVSVIDYKGHTFELAQYRSDLYDTMTNGKGADKVEIVNDFKSDSMRRDYSINGLGIDANGEIIDHVGGLKDIENKVISTIGDPNLRFKEDQIRTMRGVRLSSRLGFNIDQKTIDAIKSNAPEIKKVAAERIYKELWKMSEQTGERFAAAIVMLRDLGLLQYIIPEIVQLKGMKHSASHHPEGELDDEGDPNVFGHVIEALKTYKGKDPLVNWSILFHDLGKLSTHAISDKGTHSYHGHAKEALPIIDTIAKRLTLPNDVKEVIKFVAESHMKIWEFERMNNAGIANLMKSPYFDVLMETAKADSMARGSSHDNEEWQRILNKINHIREIFKDNDAINKIKKVINGKLVMDLTGLKPSKQLGDVIDSTINYILDNELDTDKDINTIKDFIINQVKGI